VAVDEQVDRAVGGVALGFDVQAQHIAARQRSDGGGLPDRLGFTGGAVGICSLRDPAELRPISPSVCSVSQMKTVLDNHPQHEKTTEHPYRSPQSQAPQILVRTDKLYAPLNIGHHGKVDGNRL
jgi:hypothetical protein